MSSPPSEQREPRLSEAPWGDGTQAPPHAREHGLRVGAPVSELHGAGLCCLPALPLASHCLPLTYPFRSRPRPWSPSDMLATQVTCVSCIPAARPGTSELLPPLVCGRRLLAPVCLLDSSPPPRSGFYTPSPVQRCPALWLPWPHWEENCLGPHAPCAPTDDRGWANTESERRSVSWGGSPRVCAGLLSQPSGPRVAW